MLDSMLFKFLIRGTSESWFWKVQNYISPYRVALSTPLSPTHLPPIKWGKIVSNVFAGNCSQLIENRARYLWAAAIVIGGPPSHSAGFDGN